MVARIKTVAFQGIEVLDVDVQVQASIGLGSYRRAFIHVKLKARTHLYFVNIW